MKSTDYEYDIWVQFINRKENIMKNSSLIVIDLQNDITKNYKEIIERVNRAIDWADSNGFILFIFGITTCLPEREHLSPTLTVRSWCRN